MVKIIGESQVVIVGAGVVGCAIAQALTEGGVDVLVVDASGIGEGTSSATLGLVWVQGKEPAEYMELNLASAHLHAQLAEKFDEDVGLRQPGGLIICPDREELECLLQVMEHLNNGSRKYQAIPLDARQVREYEPMVSPDVAGGIFGPHDGHINPIKLVHNLARLARRQGARFVLHSRVHRILLADGGHVEGIEVEAGVIHAKKVVIAAGTGVPDLIEPLGFQLPMKFVRGEILVTAPIKPFLNLPSRHIRQTEERNLLLGSTKQEAGLDRSTTDWAARKIAQNAIKTMPVLKDIPVVRQYAGIRPMPIDGKPYFGPVERVPGLFVAVSHSGITLSAVYGKIMSDLIIHGQTNIPIDLYRPERYVSGAPETGGANHV